jgi:ribose transport system permease protein
MNKNETTLIELTPKPKLLKKINRLVMQHSEVGVIIPFILLVLFIGILEPTFFSLNNISSVLRSAAFIGIVAIGQTLVILTGEIDVSVGSVAGLGAIMATWFMTHGVEPVSACLFSLLLCGVVGFVNGVIVVKFSIPSFITTIGMLYIAKGITMTITNGYPIYPLPDLIKQLSSISPLGTSWAFICFILLIIVFNFILRKTIYGRNLFATGDNKEVAKLAGINVTRIKIISFLLSSIFAGIAGILLSFELLTGSPTIGSGWELLVVASVAIGGISLLGGSGSMIGTFFGVLILVTLNNGLVFLGISTHWQTVAVGVVMILAVMIDMFNRKKKVSS